MKTYQLRSVPWILSTCALIALTQSTWLEAGAARTRPGGQSRATTGQSSSRASTSAARTSGATRASGQATYGYTRGRSGSYPYHHGSYGYYGYYGHHAYPWYPSWAWGWYYPTWAAYPGMTVRVAETTPAAIETDVRPKKAEVSVDGELAGQARDFNGTWDLLWLDPGEHLVEFAADGYMTLRRHVRLRAGGYVRLEARLEKGEGVDPRSTEAPPPVEVVPKVAADRPEENLTLETRVGAIQSGLLKLAVLPDDAAVYLDGEFLARAGELSRLHGALPVAQGEHTLEIVRPGYVSESRRIVVVDGEPTRIEVVLVRQER